MSEVPVLGVDAGGSATRAVVMVGEAVVKRFDEPPLNVLLQADAFDRLARLITDSGAAAAGLGLAGLRGDDQADELQRRLHAATGVDVVVADDTAVALLGAFGGEPGIVVICGTGSNAFGRAPDGRTARVGGHGFLLGDEGGAYWIASQALRAALHSHDGTGPKAPRLEEAVTAFYGGDFDAIVRTVHGDPADRQFVAKLARVVMAIDEPVMVAIVDAGADFLVEMARALRTVLGADLPVAMHGGIFGDPYIRGRFVAGTGAVEPAKSPEFGAVELARSGAAMRGQS